MRPSANSQAGRILALLEMGGWWSTRELLNAVPAIVHSRISDLRAKGYVIEHKTTGPGAAGNLYRIVGFEPTALHSRQEPSPVSPVVSGAAPPVPQDASASSPDEEGVGAAATTPSSVQMSMLEPKEDHQYARETAA